MTIHKQVDCTNKCIQTNVLKQQENISESALYIISRKKKEYFRHGKKRCIPKKVKVYEMETIN